MIAKEELNILWSLEQTAEKYEDRVAVSDVNQELTWKGLVKKAQEMCIRDRSTAQ